MKFLISAYLFFAFVNHFVAAFQGFLVSMLFTFVVCFETLLVMLGLFNDSIAAFIFLWVIFWHRSIDSNTSVEHRLDVFEAIDFFFIEAIVFCKRINFLADFFYTFAGTCILPCCSSKPAVVCGNNFAGIAIGDKLVANF